MTTSFDDLRTEVYTWTNREDLVNETTLAIQASTHKYHGIEFWDQDRVEEEVSVTPSDGLFQVDTALDLSVPLRRIEYIQNSDTGKFLSGIHPKNLFDDYDRLRDGIFYLVGSKINCRASTVTGSVLVGYSKHIVTAPASYNSWIANLYPFIISVDAAITVFNSIGESAQVKQLQALQREHVAILKINHLPIGG